MKMEGSRAVLAVGLFSSVLVAILAISSGSLWGDELGTWFLTRADSIPDWWERFLSKPDSDTQIPLYHFFMYGWTSVAGTAAVAMRASNAGMFVIANLALLWPFRFRPNIALPLILMSSLSAPVWYYLNEIRPYIMLYMGACVMIGATIEMMGSKEKPGSLGMIALCVGAVISSGSTVIGIVWAASVALFLLAYWLAVRKRSLSDLINKHYFILGITVLCIAALIFHDIRMFALGRMPALLGDGGILTFLFSLYADLGLLGVGPGMLDMRENGVAALAPYAPIIIFAAILFGLVAIGGLFEVASMLGIRTIAILTVCILLPTLFVLALGVALHWRVLPRHFMPLVSLFSLLYSFGLAWWWHRGFAGKAAALMLVVVMGYSAFSMRYAPRHAKDDYKHAAELAASELARDGRVWWAADVRGALYYGVPVSDELASQDGRQTPGVQVGISWKTASFLSGQPRPTLVLLSKPETFDPTNLVSNYLADNKYQLVEAFPAFTAWRR
jgi:hypothetical protein